MNKQIKEKIKEMATAFGAALPFRGKPEDDRMRQMKESCFEEGARQMWELMGSPAFVFQARVADSAYTIPNLEIQAAPFKYGAAQLMGIDISGKDILLKKMQFLGCEIAIQIVGEVASNGALEMVFNKLIGEHTVFTHSPEWETPGYVKITHVPVIETNEDDVLDKTIMTDLLKFDGGRHLSFKYKTDESYMVYKINEYCPTTNTPCMDAACAIGEQCRLSGTGCFKIKEEPNNPAKVERSVATAAKSAPKKPATKKK